MILFVCIKWRMHSLLYSVVIIWLYFRFPLSNIDHLHALVVPTKNMASTSGGGAGVGGS